MESLIDRPLPWKYTIDQRPPPNLYGSIDTGSKCASNSRRQVTERSRETAAVEPRHHLRERTPFGIDELEQVNPSVGFEQQRRSVSKHAGRQRHREDDGESC